MTEKEIQALKDERDALANRAKLLVKEKNIAIQKQRAAELLLKKAIKVPVNYKGLIPFMVYDYDSSLKSELNGYLCMTDSDWGKSLSEIEAEAGRKGYLEAALNFDPDYDAWWSADQYAATVRKGGE